MAVATIYCCVVKDGLYLQVHDLLDDYVADYKLIKDNHLFWSFHKNVPFLGGIDIGFLISDLKAYTWLYMIFPTFVALLAGWYLKVVLSILGFRLLGTSILGIDHKNIYIMIGFIYGILPTYPICSFGFASLPLILWLLISLYKHNKLRYHAFLLLIPFLSDFSFFGFFICSFILLSFIIILLVSKKPLWRFLIAIVDLSVGYILTELPLFYMMFVSKTETIRSTYITDYLDFKGFVKNFISLLVSGLYHAGSLHAYVVLPVCLGYFLYLNIKYVKKREFKGILKDPVNWIIIFLVFNCFALCFGRTKIFVYAIDFIFPQLKGFSFDRTMWFSPFLWYLLFMIVLCRLQWKEYIKVMICILSFMVVCIFPSSYNHISANIVNSIKKIEPIRSALWKSGSEIKLSYGEFYSVELFDEIKDAIKYDGEWSVAYGFHPSVLVYNEISTLDGYQSSYPLVYKDEFEKLIRPDLEVDHENAAYFERYGGRAYVFSKDIDWMPVRTLSTTEAELLIDPIAFKSMGGKFIFSRVRITNADELGLVQLGEFSNDISPYTIWVYEAI